MVSVAANIAVVQGTGEAARKRSSVHPPGPSIRYANRQARLIGRERRLPSNRTRCWLIRHDRRCGCERRGPLRGDINPDHRAARPVRIDGASSRAFPARAGRSRHGHRQRLCAAPRSVLGGERTAVTRWLEVEMIFPKLPIIHIHDHAAFLLLFGERVAFAAS